MGNIIRHPFGSKHTIAAVIDTDETPDEVKVKIENDLTLVKIPELEGDTALHMEAGTRLAPGSLVVVTTVNATDAEHDLKYDGDDGILGADTTGGNDETMYVFFMYIDGYFIKLAEHKEDLTDD